MSNGKRLPWGASITLAKLEAGTPAGIQSVRCAIGGPGGCRDQDLSI